MNKSPAVLGINRTQDGSLALLHGSEAVFCIQKERLTRKRHHWGKLGDIPLYVEKIPSLNQPIDLVVEGYSSDKEIKNLDEYHNEIREHLKFKNKPEIVRISHHISHAYSAFHPSPFESAAVMIIDSVGSPSHEFIEKWNAPHKDNNNLFEVASYYVGIGKNLECIGKQLWDGNKEKPVGLGQFYHLLTQCLFPGEGHEGKVMGLAPFGNADAAQLPDLLVNEGQVHIPEAWISTFKNSSKNHFFINRKGSFKTCADLAAAGQRVFETALLEISRWLQRKSGMQALCYAGGCALNCVANGVLLRDSPFTEIFVPPAPNDGGTALGCAIYGLIELLDFPCNFKWTSDCMGPSHDVSKVPGLVKGRLGLNIQKPANLLKQLASTIAQGNIVALFQGKSEFGPRALGNRSILADPRYSVMANWINQSIKGREWFRPVAPMVMEEDASTIFETDRASPFMQFAAPVQAAYRHTIPAGNHFDNTARLQTVSRSDNPFIYDLLKEFKAETKIGALLNTSFNGRGETIVETLEDAINCFCNTGIHSLVIPPYLISKNDPPDSVLALSSI